MILARYPRRAYLRSFWISLCLVLGTAGALLAGLWSASIATTVVFVNGMLTVMLFGYWYPQIAKRPYTAMYHCFEYYGRLLRFCLKLVCFFLVFAAVGWAGSKLPVGLRSTGSMWLPRSSTPAEEFDSEFEGRKEAEHPRWMATYITWARQSGNGWAVMLLPFLVLLSALEPEEERSFPANIYTLF